MNLVIDYGNTSAKVGIFEDEKLVAKYVFSAPEELKIFLEKNPVTNAMVSSVTVDSKTISSWIETSGKKFILHHTLPLPILNQYATPETLGVDRLAGVCGAQHLFPHENCLVIDAGTCITFDFIDAHRHYLGGGISPGLSMRFQAVNTFTAKLPLVHPVDAPKLIGNSTETCIQSGVVNGVLFEIAGSIDEYKKKYSPLKVILCGGDTVFFENKLKESIFAVPELVLNGLNSILTYNVSR